MRTWPLCLLMLMPWDEAAIAQATPAAPTVLLPLGVRVSATEANSPPGSCGCFVLLGGALDIGLPVHRRLTVDVEIAGQHAGTVPGTTRPLSTITLLAGPRYSVDLGRHGNLFAQTLFGAARGFDADFRRGANAVDTATSLAFALGGGYELSLSRRISLRALQVDYVQTNLPNGSDNRQRNVRFGAGLVFRLPGTALRRR